MEIVSILISSSSSEDDDDEMMVVVQRETSESYTNLTQTHLNDSMLRKQTQTDTKSTGLMLQQSTGEEMSIYSLWTDAIDIVRPRATKARTAFHQAECMKFRRRSQICRTLDNSLREG